jgi:endonuclease-3 related protein
MKPPMKTNFPPGYKPRKPSKKLLNDIYNLLFQKYGPQDWWPGDTDFEVIIGAILTQSTSWTNVEKAIKNLKKEKLLSPKALYEVDKKHLAQLIRSSGYFNAKAHKLKSFIYFLFEKHHGNLKHLLGQPWKHLRDELLTVHGIGDETADSIVLYAANQPSFVVDAYTRRIFFRLGMVPEKVSYETMRDIFMKDLDVKTELFNEYHALIVTFGKNQCKKRPVCEGCVLKRYCWFWRTVTTK